MTSTPRRNPSALQEPDNNASSAEVAQEGVVAAVGEALLAQIPTTSLELRVLLTATQHWALAMASTPVTRLTDLHIWSAIRPRVFA